MKRVTLAKARPQARHPGHKGDVAGKREEERRGRMTGDAVVKPVGTLIREIKFSNETQPDLLPLSPAAAPSGSAPPLAEEIR